MEDRCICCGRFIPEGRHVCLMCEMDVLKSGTVINNKNSVSIIKTGMLKDVTINALRRFGVWIGK